MSTPVEAWIDESDFRESQLFAEWAQRMSSGRDLNIVITAASETGVGKTTLAVALARMLDPHGWTAEKASVALPAKYDRLYDKVPPGTVLILDEAEKAADARRGMTKESVSLSQAFAAKRYRQVVSILTAPSKSWIDDRLGSDAADYWIQALDGPIGQIRGEAKVYRLRENEHYEREYKTRTEFIEWPSLDGDSEFQKLSERKEEILENDGEQKWIHVDEHQEKLEKIEKQTRKETRREDIRRTYRESDLSQTDVAEIFDVSQSHVSDIV